MEITNVAISLDRTIYLKNGRGRVENGIATVQGTAILAFVVGVKYKLDGDPDFHKPGIFMGSSGNRHEFKID
jgi:hypothetical protein